MELTGKTQSLREIETLKGSHKGSREFSSNNSTLMFQIVFCVLVERVNVGGEGDSCIAIWMWIEIGMSCSGEERKVS